MSATARPVNIRLIGADAISFRVSTAALRRLAMVPKRHTAKLTYLKKKLIRPCEHINWDYFHTQGVRVLLEKVLIFLFGTVNTFETCRAQMWCGYFTWKWDITNFDMADTKMWNSWFFFSTKAIGFKWSRPKKFRIEFFCHETRQ